jgi:hypothetical protein
MLHVSDTQPLVEGRIKRSLVFTYNHIFTLSKKDIGILQQSFLFVVLSGYIANRLMLYCKSVLLHCKVDHFFLSAALQNGKLQLQMALLPPKEEHSKLFGATLYSEKEWEHRSNAQHT